MRRHRLVLALALALWLGLMGMAVADPAPAAGADAAAVFWNAEDSYEGGSQADARLDRPVQMWRAGLPLRDVLAELTRQSGVGFDFLDPQRDDPRLPVTTYLNPKSPPSLRAVMVQLSWVTGCTFDYTEPEAKTRTYHVLWSSLGEGTAERVAADAAAQRDQFRADRQAQQEARRTDAAAALQEAKGALALAPDEAMARYQGANDALLLNLLDPSRRAGLTFLAGLSEADSKQLFEAQARGITKSWSNLTADQQAALKQALTSANRPWPTEGDITISVRPDRGGTVMAMAQTAQGRRPVGRIGGLLATGSVTGRDQIALQRALGQIQTPAQETAARAQQQQARQDARTAQREQWTQQRAQAMAATHALTPEREAALAALTLSGSDASTDLWKLQEATAKATGMNVIADCFWPPRGGFGPGGGPRRGGSTTSANALEALSAACLGGGFGFGGAPGGGDPGVEWGDAGSFLRFRSRQPDVRRAALLPEEVLAKLDGWLEPAVAAGSVPAGPGSEPLSNDLEKLSWLAAHLSDLQARLGGAMPYEDPSDPVAARRQSLRRAVLRQVAVRRPLLQITASLSEDQWQRVRGDGLKWSTDLTPEQQAAAAPWVSGRVPEGRLDDVVVHLGQTAARTITQRDGTQLTLPSVPELTFALDGNVLGQIGRGGFGGPGGGGGRRGGG